MSMLRILPVLLIGFVFYFIYVQALECGIADNMGQENLQMVIRRCTAKKGQESEDTTEKSSNSSGESEETESQTSGARRGLSSKTKRAVSGTVLHTLAKRDVASSGQQGETNENPSVQNNNDTMSEKCMVQCIFSNLAMVDANGYPDHNRVAQGLLKTAKGRELRDFLQDSTDECFQLMDQGEKLDSCEYSTHLVTCLSEKGRSNCADWQMTNLPFHS